MGISIRVPSDDSVLTEYLNSLKKSYSSLEVNLEDERMAPEIKKIFVPVPTNIWINIMVENRCVTNVVEDNGQDRFPQDNSKFKSCLDGLTNIIDPNNTDNRVKQPLICRPYWKDGIIRKFMYLNPIDIISLNKYSIIVGGPGSGKSTLLKHLSILLAEQVLSNNNVFEKETISDLLWKEKPIPVFIQLRKYVSKLRCEGIFNLNEISVNSLISFIYDGESEQFKALLKSRATIFIFDGIDEIFSNDVHKVVSKLVDTVREINRDSRIVFSTRKESYAAFNLDGFVAFELLPMDRRCREMLVRKELSQYNLDRHAQAEEFEKLQAKISSCELDEQILGNPMFVSLMVNIYMMKKELPTKKSLIIKEGIDFMIKRWQKKVGNIGKYDSSALLMLLKEIAYAVIEGNSSSQSLLISKDKVYSIIRNSKIEDEAALQTKIAKCLIDSVGIMTLSQKNEDSSTGNFFEFTHRHYQEYLLASRLVAMSDFPSIFLKLIIENKDLHKEMLFMVINILLDEEKFWVLWFILKYLLNYVESAEKTGSKEWIIWLCSKMISMRNYALLTSLPTHLYCGAKDVLSKLSVQLNKLVNKKEKFTLQQQIDALMYLGEIEEKVKININDNSSCSKKLLQVSNQLGDKRRGVLLDEKKLPDVSWCRISGGTVVLGTTPEEERILKNQYGEADFSREQPATTVQIADFEISKYPITIGQFKAFVNAGAYNCMDFWVWSDVSKEWYEQVGKNKVFRASNVDNAPIVDISWIEAASFCIWLSKVTSTKIRLPYECEWEYVAKMHNKTYSYTDNYDEEKYIGKKLGREKAAPVGVYVSDLGDSYPLDLTGNVWEWTQTEIPMSSETLQGYQMYIKQRNLCLSGNAFDRNTRVVVKGGSFLNYGFQSRNSYRGRDYIWNRIAARQGFRVVREQ